MEGNDKPPLVHFANHRGIRGIDHRVSGQSPSSWSCLHLHILRIVVIDLLAVPFITNPTHLYITRRQLNRLLFHGYMSIPSGILKFAVNYIISAAMPCLLKKA